jgi:hypothetical protein
MTMNFFTYPSSSGTFSRPRKDIARVKNSISGEALFRKESANRHLMSGVRKSVSSHEPFCRLQRLQSTCRFFLSSLRCQLCRMGLMSSVTILISFEVAPQHSHFDPRSSLTSRASRSQFGDL